jgi:hypothetical protein
MLKGNDNLLCIWELGNDQPRLRRAEHTAAVKALAWCPWQSNLLASGGGTRQEQKSAKRVVVMFSPFFIFQRSQDSLLELVHWSVFERCRHAQPSVFYSLVQAFQRACLVAWILAESGKREEEKEIAFLIAFLFSAVCVEVSFDDSSGRVDGAHFASVAHGHES